MDYLYKINRDFTGPGESYGGGAIAPIVGSVINPIAGIYDSNQQRKTSIENTKRTIAAQKAEAELAYQRQVEMWHMQNAYNSPEEQMKRFGAAGLNPHLIYGQGSAGNSQGTPSYQPANLQYKYVAPAYGQAVASAIPTMMAIGTWMQNMKLSEAELKNKGTNLEKAEEILAYLRERHPLLIRDAQNKLDLFPYQQAIQRYTAEKTHTGLADLLEEFNYKWGSHLTPQHGSYTPSSGVDGARRQEFLKKFHEARLKKSQADLFEPATIIRLVLGMAGVGTRIIPRGAGSARSKSKTYVAPGTKADNKGHLYKYFPDGSRKRVN